MRAFSRQERLGFIALCLILFVLLAVFLLPLVLSLDPYTNHLENRLAPSTFQNLLGTDQNGRDIFARIVYGGRISLIIGLLTTILAFVIGVSLGLLAGVTGGTTDMVIVQLMTLN